MATTTLTSNLDVNGDLTVSSADVLACSTYQVNLAGNLNNNNGSASAWRTGNNTFVFDGTTTINNSSNFYNFTIAAGSTVHLTSGTTEQVSKTFTAIGTSGSPITFNTTTPDSTANLSIAARGGVDYITATDINSGGGTTVYHTNSTIDNCYNWCPNISATRRSVDAVF